MACAVWKPLPVRQFGI